MPIAHRTGTRRRGRELHNAIFEATLAELVEVGYADLTMEGVATRARASKASLYRRWPGRAELVVDAVRHRMPDPHALPDTGSLRGDVLALLRRVADLLSGPMGEALRGLLAESLRDPELVRVARTRVIGAGADRMLELLRRGGARGEVRTEALTARVAEVGPALLRQHFLMYGAPVPDEVLTGIVDEVVLPLVHRRPTSSPAGP